jgi:hypothetical protein
MFTGIIAFLVVLVVILSMLANAYKRRSDDYAETVRYFKNKYQRKQGGTTYKGQILNYELLSFDGGKIWYATDLSFWPEKVVILGEAEAVYPGLLQQLDGFDKLSSYVSAHGPLDPLDPAHADLLRDAGFTVKVGNS